VKRSHKRQANSIRTANQKLRGKGLETCPGGGPTGRARQVVRILLSGGSKTNDLSEKLELFSNISSFGEAKLEFCTLFVKQKEVEKGSKPVLVAVRLVERGKFFELFFQVVQPQRTHHP
jgi:hypothetical protein